MRVAEVAAGATLSGAVSELLHYTQICPASTDRVKRCCAYSTRKVSVWCSRSLIVLGCLPERRHDLLWKVSWLSATPADTFAFGVVHIPKVIQRSSLTHLTQSQGESAAVKDLLPHAPHLWIPRVSVTHLIANVTRYVQVPLAANHSFFKPPQHL